MVRVRAIAIVELICVVVTLVALAFIAVTWFTRPTLSHPHYCLSNIKQICLAELIYSGDYDDRFSQAEGWGDRIKEYARTDSIMHDTEGVEANQYGYAFRERAGSAKQSGFQHPESTVLIFDSTLLYKNAHSELWSVPQPGRHRSADGSVAVDNLAFADGHARGFSTITPSGPNQVGGLAQALAADDMAIRDYKK